MLQITDIEIKKRLAFDNPWWEGGGVDQRYRDWPRRAFFDGFVRLIAAESPRRAVVLMGPRRVGKTVMIHQTIQKLLDDGTDRKSICYVSVDTPTYTGLWLERLFGWFLEAHGHDREALLYVFFDEIQYHPDWERHLKSLFDSYPNVRFVASGSAAAALKLKSQESGAGRFTDFTLPPLNFAEFLRFRGHEHYVRYVDQEKRWDADIPELNEDLIEYINYGGFPEAVLDPSIRGDISRYVAHDIVDKVLLRDLPSLYGIADTQELKRLFTVLAYNTGSEVTYEGLSQAAGIAKNTLRKYIEYLEAAFLVFCLHRVDQNGHRFKRLTHFKVYLTNASIRTALFGPVGDGDQAMGRLAETALISQLAQTTVRLEIYYARWSTGEIDLIHLNSHGKPQSPIEIKWSNIGTRPSDKTISNLMEFCRKNEVKDAFVASKGAAPPLQIDGVTLHLTSVSFLACVVGINLVSKTIASGFDPLKGISLLDHQEGIAEGGS